MLNALILMCRTIRTLGQLESDLLVYDVTSCSYSCVVELLECRDQNDTDIYNEDAS